MVEINFISTGTLLQEKQQDLKQILFVVNWEYFYISLVAEDCKEDKKKVHYGIHFRLSRSYHKWTRKPIGSSIECGN